MVGISCLSCIARDIHTAILGSCTIDRSSSIETSSSIDGYISVQCTISILSERSRVGYPIAIEKTSDICISSDEEVSSDIPVWARLWKISIVVVDRSIVGRRVWCAIGIGDQGIGHAIGGTSLRERIILIPQWCIEYCGRKSYYCRSSSILIRSIFSDI